MPSSSRAPKPPSHPRRYAVIGAGLAGIACARTLAQAGHEVRVLEQASQVGGRMAGATSPFGSFDSGAQYFTVRDDRFRRALETTPAAVRPWNTNAVRVLDPLGRIAEAAEPSPQTRWVGAPVMDALPREWARPLADALSLDTFAERIEPDALDTRRWQVRTAGPQGAVHVEPGFDAVLLAIPAPHAAALLERSRVAPVFAQKLAQVDIAPCWTLMLAFPQAGTTPLGPQWNAALSSHHRVAWLARESTKPGREPVERWTVQASPAWSAEHFGDDEARVTAKLLKAFAEITGIRAQPAHTQARRWRHAKTLTPLGRSHLWDSQVGLGLCGDWCLGHRVEHAFASGLELALAALEG
ncbi:NAD(P)/FAD-dependent oxidoreductase [Ramlibacter humi]|uniref:FAD-dependent oxidoreductase n=1 Tax=Ramlibacter humi TaxID=2530451 RepID=A0A4Z0CAS5_9BURK|nr:FAD-dependent oxidoreductase [Ramlibacter humi]TFZ08746.1 FAD-dependent oxidoreductase [Ramlibacter humi]